MLSSVNSTEAEAIFWESARTKCFPDETERATFRELWFGRYLQHAPGEFFLAFGPSGDLTGYLAGALISNLDPLPGPDYYALFPADQLARYPAHLHVNIRPDCRGQGIGGRLVGAFLEHCSTLRVSGAHAVTQAESRSASFFERCGLAPIAQADWHGRRLVLLGASFALGNSA